MLTCSFKSITGIDCPGCGFQRAFLELIRGNFSESFALYPSLIPLVITFIILGLFLKFRFSNGLKILMISFSLTVFSMLANYGFKMYHLYHSESLDADCSSDDTKTVYHIIQNPGNYKTSN